MSAALHAEGIQCRIVTWNPRMKLQALPCDDVDTRRCQAPCCRPVSLHCSLALPGEEERHRQARGTATSLRTHEWFQLGRSAAGHRRTCDDVVAAAVLPQEHLQATKQAPEHACCRCCQAQALLWLTNPKSASQATCP